MKLYFRNYKIIPICSLLNLLYPANLSATAKPFNIDSLEKKINQVTGLEQAALLNSLCKQFRVIQPALALGYGQRALKLATKLGNAFETGNALHNLGMIHYLHSNYQDAIGYFKPAVTIRDSIGDLRGYGNSLASIANIYYFWGDYYKAVDNYEEILDLRLKIKDGRGVATTLVNMGNVYRVRGNFDKALELYLQAIAKSDSIGFAEGEAWTFYNVAALYLRMTQYDKALEYIQRAYRIYEQLSENAKGMALCLNEIGTIYDAKGESEKSPLYYERALKLYSKLKDSYGIAHTYTNFGNFYYSHGDYQKALEYFQLSSELRNMIHDPLGRIQTAQAIAKTYFALSKFTIALQFYKQAQEIARKADMLSTMETNYMGMAQIYATKNIYKSAYEFFSEFDNIRDSLFNVRVTSRIADLQVRYETERSHRENELLRKNNKIQELTLAKERYVRYLLILIAIVGFIITVFLFLRYRSSHRMNRRLKTQKEQLSQAMAQLKKR